MNWNKFISYLYENKTTKNEKLPYEDWSDGQLIKALTLERSEYEPKALKLLEDEINRRNISYNDFNEPQSNLKDEFILNEAINNLDDYKPSTIDKSNVNLGQLADIMATYTFGRLGEDPLRFFRKIFKKEIEIKTNDEINEMEYEVLALHVFIMIHTASLYKIPEEVVGTYKLRLFKIMLETKACNKKQICTFSNWLNSRLLEYYGAISNPEKTEPIYNLCHDVMKNIFKEGIIDISKNLRTAAIFAGEVKQTQENIFEKYNYNKEAA